MHYIIDVITVFKLKKWITISTIGLAIMISSYFYKANLLDGNFMFFALGALLLITGIVFGIKSFIDNLRNYSRTSDLSSILNNQILSDGLNVVVIGGGTGLSVLLRGLKEYTSNITAVVTVADDGGGSGIIRADLGMLPPGDIRNCILALADTEPEMEKLLSYRFNDGSYKNQNLGNLLIAGMVGVSSSFEEAVKKISDIFAVVGKVLPVTIEEVVLYAKLKNGTIIKGESNIPIKSQECNSKIDKVFIKPKRVKPLSEVRDAIANADVIIYGPGSLYTSILPNLLVDDIIFDLKETNAIKIYASNIMTQPGETDGFSAGDHIKAVLEHTNKEIVDYVFANNNKLSDDVYYKYSEEGAKPVYITDEDRDFLSERKIKIVEGDYVDIKKWYVRHDAKQLSEDILKLALDLKTERTSAKGIKARKLFERKNNKNKNNLQ